jgi:hypothetical protein
MGGTEYAERHAEAVERGAYKVASRMRSDERRRAAARNTSPPARIWKIDTLKGVLVELRLTAGQAVESGLDA